MKKRVLHLLASNCYSGAENVVCTIINNCSDKYDMYYCCPEGPVSKILQEKGIKYISLKKLRPRFVRSACKKYNIDMIHAHDYKASFCAAASNFKGKIISQLHVNYDFASKWNIYTLVYRLIMNRFTKIIVVSKEIVDSAVFAKSNREKFQIITNVVDKENVKVKSEKFKTDFYDLIFVGRLTMVKNPEKVIEITRILKNKYPKIKTCIIGAGELEENCKKMIKDGDLDKNIDMLGFLSNPFPYIKNSKIALLPSDHEGLPMSVIECMILGVPVLNSGVDGMATLFKDYPDFVCNEIDDYCKMIDLILSKKKELSKMCNKIITGAVDIKMYRNRWLNLYSEVLK